MTELQKKLAELVAAHKEMQDRQDELWKAQAQFREVQKEFCNAAADHQLTNADAIFLCGATAVVLRADWWELPEPVKFVPVVDCSQEPHQHQNGYLFFLAGMGLNREVHMPGADQYEAESKVLESLTDTERKSLQGISVLGTYEVK